MAGMRSRRVRSGTGRLGMQRPVRPVSGVVLVEFLQHDGEVAGPGDQQVVEAFAAQRPDPAPAAAGSRAGTAGETSG
jgi:hypothetical protein